MTTQRMLIAVVVQTAILALGFFVGRSDKKLQRAIGIALQILSVLVIVFVLIRWGMSD
jgi:hypothetical protein